MKCTAAKIQKLHGLLQSEFSDHAVGNLQIDHRPPGGGMRWDKRGYSGEIVFDLWSSPQVWSVGRRPVQQLRPLLGDELLAWFSWREKWMKVTGEDEYHLVSAAITFGWGPSTEVVQVFRAEWCGKGRGIEGAAHPHWHCDCVVQDSRLTISRIHLGMGGWTGEGAKNACWQSYPEDDASIRRWAIRTLEYSREQFANYPPAYATPSE
jgi:hypothetical protein